MSTSITAFMGIREPAMYGVNRRLKKSFISALIGGAVGGAFLSLFKVKAYVIGGLAGLSRIPMVIGATFVYSVISFAIGAAVAAVVTYILGFEDEPEAAAAPVVEAAPRAAASVTATSAVTRVEPTMVNEEVFSPIAGEVKPLSEVNDPAFSEEIMGQGFAIQPSEGRVVSPVNGTVFSLSKSGHAIGQVSDSGAEMLTHIGIDTVKLKGLYFSPKVTAGTKVSVGDLLMEFDHVEIEKAGYSTITPVIITNIQQYNSILPSGRSSVKEKELLYTVLA
ncbi:glucose PTS transporter subunit IIA [Paenibacillus sp. FSL R10-2199]|uniref:glucose PTS transporter subunit IIA n=1 Tax=Paenibacillus sp. FSL R10-2199 TaxID=2975348 RepID=UPI0030F850C5